MGKPTAIVPLDRSVLLPVWQDASLENTREGRDTFSIGAFSSFPTFSEKWARHAPRKPDFMDTMARMFIRIPAGTYDKFLAELDDPETRRIATYLTGDDAGKGGVGYLDFILQDATQQFNEKVQVCETLSDNYVAFFFGHQAPMFTYRGTLYNTYQDDWTMRMLRIFRDLARGTQLARRGLVLYLKYDSVIVQGAMVDFRYVLQAGREMATNFDFSLLVKSVNIIYGSEGYPTDLVGEKHFAPEGYHTDDSSANNSAATNTYLGAPEGGPEGVSPEEPLVSGTANFDASGGGTSNMPDPWDEELFETPPPAGSGVESVPAYDPREMIAGSKEADPGAVEAFHEYVQDGYTPEEALVRAFGGQLPD